MKKIIHTLNGLDIEALFLETIATDEQSWDIYYAQGRIVECQNDKEIRSWDIISTLLSRPKNIAK